MKPIKLTLSAAVAALLLAGCATSGYQKADQTSKSISEFRSEIVNVKQAVDGSLAALNQTAETAASDPRKAFESFSKSVDNVESARAKAAKRADAVKAAGAAYFKQWEAELATINNPDIRALAEKRKVKLQESFAKVGPLLNEAKQDFDPFLADLKDLRTLLGQDLTVNGVDSAKSIIRKTRSSGTKLQKSMDGLLEEMNSIAASLSAAKVPEGAAGAK